MKNLDFLCKNLIAHRGVFNNKTVPENSKKAFEKAIKNNYIIELDVHIIKDSSIVVFHDYNLKRMTKKDKIIENTTLNELKKIKLLNTKYTIPTLDEVLKLIDKKVPVIIEIKSNKINYKLCREVAKILDEYKGEFAIKSFNPFIVSWFKNNRPEYIRGYLVTNKSKTIYQKFNNRLFLLKKCNPDFLSCNYNMIRNKKVKEFHKNKIVFGWTIKTKKMYLNNKDLFDNLICENMEVYDAKRKTYSNRRSM